MDDNEVAEPAAERNGRDGSIDKARIQEIAPSPLQPKSFYIL
jgi:hypothetical protein